MKTFLLVIWISWLSPSFCQDTARIKQIDLIVKSINSANFQTQSDSIINDHPDFGVFTRTYITLSMDGRQIKKYVQHVKSIRKTNGESIGLITNNIFYFDQDKLIKVEESAKGDEGKEMFFDWYFSDDKPIYYTNPSEKSEHRAAMLLSIAENMVKQIGK